MQIPAIERRIQEKQIKVQEGVVCDLILRLAQVFCLLYEGRFKTEQISNSTQDVCFQWQARWSHGSNLMLVETQPVCLFVCYKIVDNL